MSIVLPGDGIDLVVIAAGLLSACNAWILWQLRGKSRHWEQLAAEFTATMQRRNIELAENTLEQKRVSLLIKGLGDLWTRMPDPDDDPDEGRLPQPTRIDEWKARRWQQIKRESEALKRIQ
jgi:hypothetical protein